MKRLTHAAMTASTLLVLTTQAMAADYWVKDSLGNCEIWSDQPPAEGDVITWSGGCADGRASGAGLLIWTSKGKLNTRFDGEMAEGKMNGKGILVERAEAGTGLDVVTGGFENGEMNGPIIYKSAENALFVGQFKEGLMDGHVLLVEADGSSFEGTFVNGTAQGAGKTISADGEVFDGQFQDNERHGLGSLTLADGGRYVGEFAQGAITGLGRFEDPSGDTYTGAFQNDLPDGPGVFATFEGDTYQGMFRMGELNGQVLVTRKDGSQSIETWNNGERQK